MLALAAEPHNSIMVELVIHEFDHWANSNNPAVAPTTICWFEPELDSRLGDI